MQGEHLSAKGWSQEFDTVKRQIQSKRAECDLNVTEVCCDDAALRRIVTESLKLIINNFPDKVLSGLPLGKRVHGGPKYARDFT